MPASVLADEPIYTMGGERVNRFDLYEWCVQSCQVQVRFLDAVHGGMPQVLADDFAGPAGLARAWLDLGAERGAIATDIDEEPLAHGLIRAIERHGESALRRLALQRCGVLEAGGQADVVAALNFAAGELPTRPVLVTYMRHVLFRLNAGGVLVLDTYGGPDAFTQGVYEVDVAISGETVRYEWHQRECDPLTSRVRNAIHFSIPGGPRIEDAFTYDWRLWSVGELRDAMLEAGFRATEVYLDYSGALDDDGQLLVAPDSIDGEFVDRTLDGDFVAYVVGRV
ncbi:MAG: hypothetical protein AAGI30_04185 [Planctomycetota bacterium]